jgi:hypothetical protein
MIDLERITRLYLAAHDSTKSPSQLEKAASLLAGIDPDAVDAEFRTLPANLFTENGTYSFNQKQRAGDLKWPTHEDLANYVIGWIIRNPGESNDEFRAREERLRADKLGIVVRAILHGKAAGRRSCDCDFVVIGGERFHLNVWWCTDRPAHPPTEVPCPSL